MFGYHIFKFDVYDLAIEYSRLLSILLKQLRNSKNDDLQGEIYIALCNFIESVPRKNNYSKKDLKDCFLSCYQKPEKDIVELFDIVANFCCNFNTFNPNELMYILGEINGF